MHFPSVEFAAFQLGRNRQSHVRVGLGRRESATANPSPNHVGEAQGTQVSNQAAPPNTAHIAI